MIKVLKRKKRVNGRIKESKFYYLRYRLEYMPVDKWHSLGVTDKQVAEKRAREFVIEQERERAGLLDPKPVRDTAKKPLSELAEALVLDLISRERGGRNGHDAQRVQGRILRLCRECGWTYVGQIGTEEFSRWRQRQEFSPRTLNHYLEGMTTFLNWLERERPIPINPLRHAQKVDCRGKERRVRRALFDGELAKLVQVSDDRGSTYLVAARTGLRQMELASLAWGDLDLEGPAPTFCGRASTIKNKKATVLPLIPEIAGLLKAMKPLDGRAGDRVFQNGVPRARTMQRALKCAGIPYRDGMGRYADFHSLRMTFSTFI